MIQNRSCPLALLRAGFDPSTSLFEPVEQLRAQHERFFVALTKLEGMPVRPELVEGFRDFQLAFLGLRIVAKIPTKEIENPHVFEGDGLSGVRIPMAIS